MKKVLLVRSKLEQSHKNVLLVNELKREKTAEGFSKPPEFWLYVKQVESTEGICRRNIKVGECRWQYDVWTRQRYIGK